MDVGRRGDRVGLGAVPYAGGVTFRTWAPFAAAVAVVGDPDRWPAPSYAMSSDGDGTWSVDVAGAAHGDRYVFLVTTSTGEQQQRTDPRARQVDTSVGRGVVDDPTAFRWPAAEFSIPPWNELVLYELHVGTFTTSGDGGPGTLHTAIGRLDQLRDLGVNAVDLLPVAEFGGYRSKGYNTMLPFAVESDYGGPDALRDFVVEAHRRGIAVIADVVYNHFGAADLDRSLWRFDGWSENDGGGIYFYNDWRASTPWAAPRPDFGRPQVRDYVVDNVLMWLEEFRLDGLRVDQTVQMWSASGAELPDGWRTLQQINDAVDRSQPWKIMIAEDFTRGPRVTEATSRDGAGFDAQWDPFVHAVRAAVTPPWDDRRDLHGVARALEKPDGAGAFSRVVYTESHDEDGNGGRRLPEEISPGSADDVWAAKRSTLGAALVLTAPAIPMLFQGQEFLEAGWWSDDRALDWSKRSTHEGILRLYRDLVHLRRNWDDTTRGLTGEGMHLHHLDDDGKVVAFHRWHAGGPRDDVLVVANFSGQPRRDHRIGCPRSGRWRVRFNSDSLDYDSRFGDTPGFDTDTDPVPWDGMPTSAAVGVGPYAVLVLSQDG